MPGPVQRSRRFEVQKPVGSGIPKNQTVCPQCDHPGISQDFAAAVLPVADDRESARTELNTDLVTAARFEADGDQRAIPDDALNPIVKDRLASTGFAVFGGTTRDGLGILDQQIPKGARRFGVAVDDSEIFLVDRVSSKLFTQ